MNEKQLYMHKIIMNTDKFKKLAYQADETPEYLSSLTQLKQAVEKQLALDRHSPKQLDTPMAAKEQTSRAQHHQRSQTLGAAGLKTVGIRHDMVDPRSLNEKAASRNILSN